MFVQAEIQKLTSNQKGNIAEAAIALEAIKLGIEVLKPVAEHGRYDLALDLGTRIIRVQCKWARLELIANRSIGCIFFLPPRSPIDLRSTCGLGLRRTLSVRR
jgi:hypothetical protein